MRFYPISGVYMSMRSVFENLRCESLDLITIKARPQLVMRDK
jgi:hypothetical protein